MLLPLVVTELLLRIISSPNEYYLSKADPFYGIKADSNYTYNYFIGTSHVAAAIVTDVFDNELKSENIKAINIGRGSSTSIVFYLGLKRMAKRGLLNNATVFLEAPGGGPASYTDNMKKGDWVKAQNVHLLIPYLDFKTFREFWKYSTNDFSTKTDVSIKYVFYTSRIFSLAKDVYQQNTIKELGRKILFRSKEPESLNVDEQGGDMAQKGGIKTDRLNIEKARTLAHDVFKEQSKDQRVIGASDLRISVLNDMINLVKNHNGQLKLFDMPLSSVEEQVHTTDIAKQNFINLSSFLDSTNVDYITFDFSDYTDEDFPDLWHLSAKKSVEYSLSFIEKIKEKEK